MLNRTELHFKHFSILRSEQLQTLERFPREFLQTIFADFGDGILSGLDFVKRDEKIFLTAGLVKLGEKFFFADKVNLSTLMTEKPQGKRYRFVLGTPQRTTTNGVITEKISLEVKPLEEPFVGMEFGRFKAKFVDLPSPNAEDLFDEFTEDDRLNLLHVPQAIRSGTTFHPLIFRAILSLLERKEKPSPADMALMIQLANSEAVSLPALKIFVKCTTVEWRDGSPEEIFKSVIEAVKVVHETSLPATIASPEKISRELATNFENIFIDNY